MEDRTAAREGRGAALLLAHCEALGRLAREPRPPAYDRLEAELGCDLAQRLVEALAGDKPLRTAFSATARLEVA